MSEYVGSKLIVVEGLTGSGKSIMAHFIARQLQQCLPECEDQAGPPGGQGILDGRMAL